MDENTDTTKSAPVGADDLIDLVQAQSCYEVAMRNLAKCYAAFVNHADSDFRDLLIRAADNLVQASAHCDKVRKHLFEGLDNDVTLKP